MMAIRALNLITHSTVEDKMTKKKTRDKEAAASVFCKAIVALYYAAGKGRCVLSLNPA